MKSFILIIIFFGFTIYSYAKLNPEKDTIVEVTDSTRVQTLLDSVFTYYENEDFINSIYYAKKTLKGLEKFPDNYTKSSAFEIIGKSYYSMSLYSKALRYTSKALLISRELNDTNGIIVMLNDMGNIYDGVNNFDKSFEYYKESLKFSILKHDSVNMAICYNNFGVFYNQIKRYDSAHYYYSKTKKLKQKIRVLDAASNINIGSNFYDQGLLDSALFYLNTALKSKDTKRKPYYQSITYNNLAEVYLKKGEIPKAIKYNNISQKIAQEKHYYDLDIDAYLISSKIFEKKLDYKNALNSYKLYSKTNDSLTTSTQDINISYMELLFDKEKKDLEIEKYKSEELVKQLQIESYQHRQFFYFFISILSLIVALIFFIQKRQLIQSQKKIVDENVKSIDYKQEIIRLKREKPEVNPTPPNIENHKYTDSPLNEEQKQDIAEKIRSIYENDKIFLNTELNLNELSDKLNINKTYISQVFSEVLKISFTDYTNQQRIDEAKLLLANPENNNLTIEAIGENAGFKSSSTFNRVFKNITGVTPSFFKKNVK